MYSFWIDRPSSLLFTSVHANARSARIIIIGDATSRKRESSPAAKGSRRRVTRDSLNRYRTGDRKRKKKRERKREQSCATLGDIGDCARRYRWRYNVVSGESRIITAEQLSPRGKLTVASDEYHWSSLFYPDNPAYRFLLWRDERPLTFRL